MKRNTTVWRASLISGISAPILCRPLASLPRWHRDVRQTITAKSITPSKLSVDLAGEAINYFTWCTFIRADHAMNYHQQISVPVVDIDVTVYKHPLHAPRRPHEVPRLVVTLHKGIIGVEHVGGEGVRGDEGASMCNARGVRYVR